MTTKQIYEKFLTPFNLQQHMLRVAALAKILTANWKVKGLDGDPVIRACLIHDIAKPITFDPGKQTLFGMSKQEVDNLKKLQEMVMTKYGTEEHPAALEISKELELNSTGVRIMDNLEWYKIPELIRMGDRESQIAVYCDMRIGPQGILLMEERLADLKRREPAKDHENYAVNGKKLETEIIKNVSVDVNSVTNTQINSYFTDLMNLEF